MAFFFRRVRMRTGMLLIITAALLWGTSGATGRYLNQTHAISPLTVSFYRLAIGAIVLMALTQRGRPTPGSYTHIGALALIGAGMALYQASFFVAVSLAGVSLSTLVALGLAPVLVATASALILKQTPDRRVMLSLVAALAGLALLVGNPAPASDGGNVIAGAALAMLSAAGFAGVTLLGRWIGTCVAPMRTTTWGFGVGAALLLPLVLVQGLEIPSDPLAIALLVYLGVGPTALAYSAFFFGIRSVIPSASSILTLIEPLTATLIAVVFFQERMSPLGAIGTAAMILAMLNLCVSSPAVRSRDGHTGSPQRVEIRTRPRPRCSG